MPNHFVSGGLALIALLSTGPAFAQAFQGPHAGVQGGGEKTDVRDPATGLGTATIDAGRQAFTGGLFVGYDRQVAPRIVIGAEAGMDLSANDAVGSTSGTGFVSIDPEWSIDLTTRAGYLVNPQTLAYVRGGYTNARVETTVTTGQAQFLDSEHRNGWLLGAGIERLILQNISGRLEYRYSDLSDSDDTVDRHRILAGIAYRF